MGIIGFAINNPVKIAVASILVCLFGMLAIFNVPRQLTPDVDKPVVSVHTYWSGASPQEIESEIVDRQEDKLKGVPGLQKMTSDCREGSASVSLEFDVDVNKDTAFRDVSEKLRQVTGYPDEVDEPTVTSSDDDMSRTIAWLMLHGPTDLDVSTLKTFAEDKVKPILERAEGIASVAVYGGRDREVQVRVDPLKLAARGLTFRDVEQALRLQNTNISAGTTLQGKRDFTFRTVGEFTNTQQIEDTVVAYRQGGPVRVGDVGRVVDGFKKQFAFVRSKGEFVIAMPARRETGANVVETMANLKRQIREVNETVLPTVDSRLVLDQTYDESVYISSAIDLVTNNILVGGALAVIVLFVFLRSASATGIVAVAIPISVVGTFLVITLAGRTLNVVLLAGMAFAVGMVVDNAIVVLENIYRHREMGKSRQAAAFDGAREVWGAVLASTLTTIAVFLPVVFIKEEAGQLFGDIAVAVSSAVGLSLIVSVLVIPPLAAKVLGRARNSPSESSDSSPANPLEKSWIVSRLFAGLVGRINKTTPGRLAVVAGFTGVSLYASYLLMPDTDYLPAGNRNLVFGFLITPPGYSIEEFKKMAYTVEDGDPDDPNDGIRPIWEAELGSPQAAAIPPVRMHVGAGGVEYVEAPVPPIDNFFFVTFGGGSFMGCTSKVEENVAPLVQKLQNAAQRIPGVFAVFSQASLFGRGLSGGNSIELEVRGIDHEKVVSAASALFGKLMDTQMGRPRPSPTNFDLGSPEVQIVPDRAKAADLGLNVRDIGFILEACVNGAFVGEFNDHGDRIDMALVVDGTESASADEIGRIPVFTPSGHVVPIRSAVSVVRTTAPQQINHIEEMDAVTLIISPPKGMALQTAMNKVAGDVIQPLRDAGAIDQSIITALAGNADKLTTTQHALIGDFRGTVHQPALFGMSVAKSMLAIGLIALIIVVGLRLAAGAHAGVSSAWIIAALLGIGFLAINPQLALRLFESRAALAVAVTYLLMAALFESFVYPFVIMFSVPLAAVGGFAALRIVHEASLGDVTTPIQQLDVLTMLGFIILLGVVVNNAILVVHQAITNMREYGMPADEAVANSVQVRTRPIFMSAMTSVFGMLPLVLMTGAGSELYRGIGSVVVGGLTLSTIFTLIVVPALFSLVMQWRSAVVEEKTVGETRSAREPLPETNVREPAMRLTAAPGHRFERSPDRH